MMGKHLYIFKHPELGWVIMIRQSPIMGDLAWQHNTWWECMLHADVLLRVWNHI